MFRHHQIYLNSQTLKNGQNTSIKNHNIIFPLSPGHMNITVMSRNINIGTCKTINSDSAEQDRPCTLTWAPQSTVRHAYANAKITFSMNHLTA